MKYRVGGGVHASTYIGEFEANTPWQAIEMAYNEVYISVCHQCSSTISDPEPVNLWAEDENGDVTQESSAEDVLRDRIKFLESLLAEHGIDTTPTSGAAK